MKKSRSEKRLGTLFAFAALFFAGAAAAQDTQVIVNTGNTDVKLGALSRRPSTDKKETETADDFVLKQTTVLTGATIIGLIAPATPTTNISNVEVEVYHVFPEDSIDPPSGSAPSRVNSPSDVEIASATRDASNGTLTFAPRLLNSNVTVPATVTNNIKKKPLNLTHGDGPATGAEVEITITFSSPIVLPAGNYFFRPEVQVEGADFLYLSAPRPIVAPGIAIPGDRQAWIRNSDLAPDWLRIGTDIIADPATPTYNMTFTLSGAALQFAGTSGQASCHGDTVSGLSQQFGSVSSAASALGFPSVKALQDAFRAFCEQ